MRQAVSADTSAQKKEPFLKFSGYSTVTYDFYHIDTSAGSSFRPRQPKHLVRFIAAPMLSIGKHITLPFELNISSVATNVTSPVEQYKGQFDHWYGLFKQLKTFKDVKNYLSNPINRVGFAPTFGKFKFYMGTQTPVYSDFTVGNISLFGVGMDMNLKWLFFSVNRGTTQHAIERDSTQNIGGAFQRKQTTLRLGFGNIEKSYIAFNSTYGVEDGNSIKSTADLTAQTAYTGSLEYQIKIKKGFKWKTEMAVGVRTANNNYYDNLSDTLRTALKKQFSDPIEQNLPPFVIKNLPINPTTTGDFAASTQFNLLFGNVGLDLKGLYVGPGFKPVGYPFFISDRLDATVGTRFSLFKNHLSFNGTFGKRISNLSKKLDSSSFKLPTFKVGNTTISLISPSSTAVATTQDLINVNLNLQLTDNLGIDAAYANFGIQNTVVNDSLRVRNIGHNFSLTPTYFFDAEKASHNVALVVSLDQFRDLNIISGAENDNDNKIANLSYTHTRKSIPLSLTANVGYFNIVSSNLTVNNTTLTLGAGYDFFKNTLNTALSFTGVLNNQAIAINPGSPLTEAIDKQILFNFRTGYKPKKGPSWQLTIGNNFFDRGGPNADRLNELTGRVSVQQNF